MSGFIASDNQINVADAEALLLEIARLQRVIEGLESQVRRLDELAHHDPLVGLGNRRSFMMMIERYIARVGRYGEPAALMFVDLDDLKLINDTFGHEAGDVALQRTAQLLITAVRRSDFLARIGGDEFAIILDNVDELAAWQLALRVVENVADCEINFGVSNVRLSVAVGIAVIKAGDTIHSVMDRADKAMYRIKNSRGYYPLVHKGREAAPV